MFNGEEVISIKTLTQRKALNIINLKYCVQGNKFKIKMTDTYGINEEEWLEKYAFIKKWSNNTKNRAFLWRFLYGLVYTNEDFVRFGFKESKNCSFCNAEGQTKEHLFLLCPKVIEFRKKVFDTYENLIEGSKVTDKVFLFGISMAKNTADDERVNTYRTNEQIYLL